MHPYPYHRANWPRAWIRPDEYGGGEHLMVSFDLGAVDDKEKPKVIKAWCQRLPELKEVRWLSLWSHVTPPLFEAACRMPQLECLEIKWSNIRSLEPIRQLEQLRYLKIGSSTKVESIEPLAALRQLKLLELENFKLITDFSPLQALTGLEELAVIGSMWSRQKVGSLDDFAAMTWLRDLAVDTSSVKSLRPLASLTGLKNLGIGGRLPMAEYAWLAAKLPNTSCKWFGPWLDMANSGIGKCKKCSAESMVMLTGATSRPLCRICDQAKVRRHEQAFEAARQQAMATA